MKLKLIAIEILPNKSIKLSFDITTPITNLKIAKNNLGLDIDLERLEMLFDD